MRTNIHTMHCACCGDITKGRQWFNQDRGYGLCARCAKWIEGRHGRDYVEDAYGKFGIHHSLIEEVMERGYE